MNHFEREEQDRFCLWLGQFILQIRDDVLREEMEDALARMMQGDHEPRRAPTSPNIGHG